MSTTGDYIKEIEKLKKENKKLRKALENEGINPETEVLEKKTSKILNGRELRIAAEKGLEVRCVVQYENPFDKHMNYNEECIMEKCSNDNKTPDEHWYYIGDSDICLEYYGDEDPVVEDFGEGKMQVFRVKGVKYT